jgi:hypothetical protein
MLFPTREKSQLQAVCLRGFHPNSRGSPDAITPGQVFRLHRSAQGRYGGTGSCPLRRLPCAFYFVSEKFLSRAKIKKKKLRLYTPFKNLLIAGGGTAVGLIRD